MFISSNIQVPHTFTMIVLIAESTLKFINDIRSKIFKKSINFIVFLAAALLSFYL